MLLNLVPLFIRSLIVQRSYVKAQLGGYSSGTCVQTPEYEGIEDAHYAYRVRDHLLKEVLVPLRKVLKIPEIYMSSNQWNVLPYSRVPSIAMKNYKSAIL